MSLMFALFEDDHPTLGGTAGFVRFAHYTSGYGHSPPSGTRGESTGLTYLWEARALLVTASSLFEEVFLIHLYAVGEAYLAHFIGIRFLGVMLILPSYIASYRWHTRCRNGYGAIAFTPSPKARKPCGVVLHIFAGAGFQVAHKVGHCHLRAHEHKKVYVVRHATYLAHLRLTALYKTTDVAVEVVGVVGRYDPLAGERAKHDMVN